MASSHEYTLGLPATITVHEDGTVEIAVYIAEAELDATAEAEEHDAAAVAADQTAFDAVIASLPRAKRVMVTKIKN